MKIGVMIGADGTNMRLDDVIATIRDVEARGFDTAWMANIFSFDAISTLSMAGRETERVRLGTAVTPTYPRHPTALAQQAMTAAAASGNRFTLGIGLSHQVVIENMLGLSYARRATHMREYLSVLMPLLRGETCNFNGEEYRVNGVTLDIPGAEPVPVVIAALGPAMLKVAGELADGTNTWMVGPRTLEDHIAKNINAAADAAGRAAPQIVAGIPIALTTKVEEAKAQVAETLTIYGQLPSYRAMLDREGAAGPADIALLGDENALRGDIERLRSAGVTQLNAAVIDTEPGVRERTLDFLGSLT
ncbi:MAG: TIGR03564 family F420-dependent LLM class oxidoreductase [Pseudomonadota bacterium]